MSDVRGGLLYLGTAVLVGWLWLAGYLAPFVDRLTGAVSRPTGTAAPGSVPIVHLSPGAPADRRHYPGGL